MDDKIYTRFCSKGKELLKYVSSENALKLHDSFEEALKHVIGKDYLYYPKGVPRGWLVYTFLSTAIEMVNPQSQDEYLRVMPPQHNSVDEIFSEACVIYHYPNIESDRFLKKNLFDFSDSECKALISSLNKDFPPSDLSEVI